jgi:general secretion pathway protein G
MMASVWLERARAARLRGNRAAQRGATLVEVLIVVAIMALLASGVALAVFPKFKDAQIKTAGTSARALRRAVQTWQMMNNETTCPTLSMLIQTKQLDSSSSTDDPWGQPFELWCSEDEVHVTSYGPDKKKDTADDIVVPPRRGNEG